MILKELLHVIDKEIYVRVKTNEDGTRVLHSDQFLEYCPGLVGLYEVIGVTINKNCIEIETQPYTKGTEPPASDSSS